MKKLSVDKMILTIRKRRKDMNLTQADLAKVTGINRVTIGRIENKEYIPSIEQLQSLGEALDFEPIDLFIEEQKNNISISKKKYNIAVAGTGYVGLSIAVLLAQHNHVTAVDILKEKIDLINRRANRKRIESYCNDKRRECL